MIDTYKKHTQVTQRIKEWIQNLNVVFPKTYGKMYKKLAIEHDLELKHDEILDGEILDETIINYIVSLYECTDNALDAMMRNDADKLKEIIKETEKLKEEIKHLQQMVYEDPLTHAYNRKWFEDHYIVTDEKITLRGAGTLVLVDLNRFKEINDTYGHIVGDKVLTQLAEKLRETEARIVRYGGDEFLLIFDKAIVYDEIIRRIENVISYLKRVSFKTDEGNFKISFAFGTATFKEGDQIEYVIDKADKAMYEHKSKV